MNMDDDAARKYLRSRWILFGSILLCLGILFFMEAYEDSQPNTFNEWMQENHPKEYKLRYQQYEQYRKRETT